MSKFIGNVLWLTFLQGINFLAPLVVLPYLIQTLGVQEYGLYVFSAVIISYLGIFCDYGFNLTGTRDVSLVKKSNKRLTLVFSKIISIKIFIFFICILIFIIAALISDHIRENIVLYLCAFSVLIGQTFFPVWFFQGVEDFKLVVILNCISRAVFTFLVFMTVKGPGDAYLAAMMNSLGGFSTLFFAIYICRKKYKIKFIYIKFSILFRYAKKSFYIFLAQLKISLFSSSNILILGIISGTSAVGYFSAAEKIMRALAQLQIPVLTVLYPKLSIDIINDERKSLNLIMNILKLGTFSYIVLCSIIFIFAAEIISFLFGPGFEESIVALRIIIICPLLIFQNNIFGTQILLNLGKNKIYLLVLLFVGITSVILTLILTYTYNFIGTSVSLLISEILVVILMFYFSKLYFFNNFNKSRF